MARPHQFLASGTAQTIRAPVTITPGLLAHAERQAVRAAYHFAEHLPERQRMLQGWAGYPAGPKGITVMAPARTVRG